MHIEQTEKECQDKVKGRKPVLQKEDKKYDCKLYVCLKSCFAFTLD